MAGLSCLLLVISFVSWKRLGNLKLALVGFAFLAFFIKAVLLITEIIVQDEKSILIDSFIIVLLYFSILKR